MREHREEREMTADYYRYAKTILVVVDDTALRSIICRQLSYAGYRVVGASSAKLSASLVRRCGLPHLAIVDVSLPDMSGCELCRHIRADGDVPVVMLADASSIDATAGAVYELADDCITKPLNVRDLLERVDRLAQPPSLPNAHRWHSTACVQ